VLTIHNIGYQGVFSGALVDDLALAGVAGADGTADLNFLRTGVATADALTTVSPTHAAEILTPEYGKGLDGLLNRRRDRLVGILNGVDYGAWDPATDPALPSPYAATDLSGKQACRRALLERARLPDRAGVPLLGMVTRLTEQKGVELAVGALAPLLAQGRVQGVILGQGEERYVRQVAALAERFPAGLGYFDAQDEALARLVFAGADGFLVPSLYEPCGLTQMYALRYGAVPVVRETGGLRDTVQHFDPGTGRGTGSVFKDADVNGLAWAIGELLAWYGQPATWLRVRQNGMACDFSWQHQAPLYERLYADVTASRPA
jgi:starch synthase